MKKSSGYGCRWLLLVALVSTNAAAQSFSHSHGSEHFEAVVTGDRVVVKERFQGATTIYGDLSCPLGPAVKASTQSSTQSRLCLSFAKDRCTYTRHQDGVAIHTDELANSRMPKMCIALANVKDARRFVALVNKGPQHSKPAAIAAAMPPAAEGASAEESKAAPEKSDGPSAEEGRPPTRSAETQAAPKTKAVKKKSRSARKSTASRAKAAAARKAKTRNPVLMPNPAAPAHAHE